MFDKMTKILIDWEKNYETLENWEKVNFYDQFTFLKNFVKNTKMLIGYNNFDEMRRNDE